MGSGNFASGITLGQVLGNGSFTRGQLPQPRGHVNTRDNSVRDRCVPIICECRSPLMRTRIPLLQTFDRHYWPGMVDYSSI